MTWKLENRGFLPNEDPLEMTPFRQIEDFAAQLPTWVDEGHFRLHARTNLADLDLVPLLTLLQCKNDRVAERLFRHFCYFASAYIHSKGTDPTNRLPKQIAQPLILLATYLGRLPILSYASYCLNNWRRIDKDKPIELGNIALLQNFSRETKRDEDWFVLVHVEIEAHAAKAIESLYKRDGANLDQILHHVVNSMIKMNETLARMPEQCDPDVYFSHVRPYIFGFDKIHYEGCFDEQPQTFRGETGAQSSILPTLLNAFGIKHRNSLLIKHLNDMLNYMPKEHAEIIRGTRSLRDDLWTKERKEVYNECINQLVIFRTKHFEYAVNYIEKKVNNPTGTGGTPYIPWLKELVEETKEYFI